MFMHTLFIYVCQCVYTEDSANAYSRRTPSYDLTGGGSSSASGGPLQSSMSKSSNIGAVNLITLETHARRLKQSNAMSLSSSVAALSLHGLDMPCTFTDRMIRHLQQHPPRSSHPLFRHPRPAPTTGPSSAAAPTALGEPIL